MVRLRFVGAAGAARKDRHTRQRQEDPVWNMQPSLGRGLALPRQPAAAGQRAPCAHVAQEGCKRREMAADQHHREPGALLSLGANIDPIPFWSPWQCSHPNHLWVVGMLTCAASDVRGEGAIGSSYCPDPNKVASSRCQLCQGDIGAVLPCCQVPCWCRRALLVHAEQVSIPLPRRGLPVHSQSPGSADGACRQGKRR